MVIVIMSLKKYLKMFACFWHTWRLVYRVDNLILTPLCVLQSNLFSVFNDVLVLFWPESVGEKKKKKSNINYEKSTI